MRSYIPVFFACLVLAACKKEPHGATPDRPTLRQYVGQDTSLSLFELALERSGLDTLLATGGPFTIFAPMNGAFLAAGLTADSIANASPAWLYGLLGYQILEGRIGTQTLQGFTTDSTVTVAGQYRPLVSLNYYGLFIDGIPVTDGNIELADGILQKIGQMAVAPTGTLLQVLNSLPNTTMAAYIFNQSMALNQLAQNTSLTLNPPNVLNGQLFVSGAAGYQSCTLLIPSDAAFQAYGFHTIADLAALDSATRTNLIYNGVLIGTYFTSDFLGGQVIGAFNNYRYKTAGGKLTIYTLAGEGMEYWSFSQQYLENYILSNQNYGATYEVGTDGLSLIGNGVVTPPRIVEPNIVTTTGVVHIIDAVFSPVGTYIPGHSN